MSSEIFRSTEWAPIGTAAGQTIWARHVRYNELGSPRCEYAAWSEALSAYRLGKDEYGLLAYLSEAEPGVSYHPAGAWQGPLPERVEVRQGWQISPHYLADGRPWVFPRGGAESSANRPPMPDFSDPTAVAELDAIIARYKATIPPPPARIDLYRACEGDNPALLRGE
jgi:hypothetical protein